MKKNSIDQDGQPYAKDMVDTEIVKLDWLLKYPKVKERHDILIAQYIKSENAINLLKGLNGNNPGPLKRFLQQKGNFRGYFDALEVCGHDIEELHKKFQFQRAAVSQFHVLSFRNLDLLAALRNFIFCAAIGDAYVIQHQRYSTCHALSGKRYIQYIARIDSIYVCAKDNYSFTDDTGKSSQYLGHWNKWGMILSVPSILGSEK